MENNKKYGNTQILNREKINGTPFHIITTNEEHENKSFIAIGNRRVSNLMTYEEAKILINKKHWELIVSLVTVISEAVAYEIKREDIKIFETLNDKYRKEQEEEKI